VKVSALALVRNGTRLDLPFIESIRSGLPLCDEFIVVVGRGADDTRERVAAIGDPRIRIVDTEWSDRVSPRKCVLAQQTNIGLHLCTGDWVVCLQANDVLHEDALPDLREAMRMHVDDPRIEALLFERLTFWGDYTHVLRTYPDRFKYTARILRPYIGTFSIRDAMSFAVFDGFSKRGRYPRSIDTGQDLHRYGFLGPPERFAVKNAVAVHWGDNPLADAERFLYQTHPRRFIVPFTGTHPAVMQARIAASTFRMDDASPLWRTRPTLREWARWWETRLYERFGLPAWRSPRQRLQGRFLPKSR